MLENTLYRLQNNLETNVVYFGGSITEGAGASDYKNCWASKTTKWIRDTYPMCTINHISAAIGGTGSTLGVFRCDNEVCAKKPDLVFYEFAINDFRGEFFEIANNTDAIFRKIRKINPYADIIMIYTTTKMQSDVIATGTTLTAKTAHSAVAYYYGDILQIDVGEVLRQRVLLEGKSNPPEEDWKKYTVDDGHPNDAGYAVYADTVIRKIQDEFKKSESPIDLSILAFPAPLFPSDVSRINAHMEDVTLASVDKNWMLSKETLCGRYPHYMECTEPGGEMTFRFVGRYIGLYLMLARDGGDIVYTIDNKEEKEVRAWDTFCPSFNRVAECCLANNLPYGIHTVRLRVADTKAEQSEGTTIRIGAFLIA